MKEKNIRSNKVVDDASYRFGFRSHRLRKNEFIFRNKWTSTTIVVANIRALVCDMIRGKDIQNILHPENPISSFDIDLGILEVPI